MKLPKIIDDSLIYSQRTSFNSLYVKQSSKHYKIAFLSALLYTDVIL